MKEAAKTGAKRLINIVTFLGGLWSAVFIVYVGIGKPEYVGQVILFSLGIFLAIGVVNYLIFGEVGFWHSKDSFE